MKVSLRYKAAKLALGNLNADDIKSTIHDLLEHGIYLDAFLDALNQSRPRMDEVLPALLAALRHNGVSVPDKEEAVWQLIEYHLDVIDSGAEIPFNELERLITDVYWDYDFHPQAKEFLGDSHGIEHLIGLYWGADDLRENPESININGKYGQDAWVEINHQIFVESKRWLASRR